MQSRDFSLACFVFADNAPEADREEILQRVTPNISETSEAEISKNIKQHKANLMHIHAVHLQDYQLD
ncbi:hypothetical protein C0J52_16495 [Blattella germanica]|nr:hypothetical protein C0J52_16495 [Blattella germanica]